MPSVPGGKYRIVLVTDNTILKTFYYIANILDSSWLFSVSTASMEESCAGMKVNHSIFNRKTHIGVKRGKHPRFQ